MDNGAVQAAVAAPDPAMPTPSGPAPAAPVPQLAVSGLVVTKAALIAALRLFIPQVVDVEPLENEGFLLRLTRAAEEPDTR